MPRFIYVDKNGKQVKKGDLTAVTKLSPADAKLRGVVLGADDEKAAAEEEESAPAETEQKGGLTITRTGSKAKERPL